MEQQKPQIPSLKDSQKPQVKIKGLQAGLSLIDRLKQFKKKDLMFISAGLGVLFMAPLAEHLLMSPEQGRGSQMSEGWSFGNKDGLGTNASLYENGINGLAPGGVTGGGDIITPLNVRDPSALVMGPGAQQQAPATNTTPAPPPPPKEDEKGWRDALANSASAAAKEATKKASLPVPKPSLTNAGLRGLGAVAGGGGGSFSPGAISSQGLTSNKAEGRGFNRVQAAPGYRGAAGARGANSGSSGSFENLKKAAGGMTDTLNRSGPASSALESAANSGMGGGAGSGIGGGGHGADEKGPSGSQNKDSMNVGESLEFMRQKMEQEKALDLKWKLKEADAMLWPELRKDILKTLVTKPLEGLAGDIGKSFGAWGGGKSGGMKQVVICNSGKFNVSEGFCVAPGGVLGLKDKDSNCVASANPTGNGCYEASVKGEDTAPKGKTEGSPSDLSGVAGGMLDGPGEGTGKGLGELCEKLKAHSADAKLNAPTRAMAAALLEAGKLTVEAGQGMLGGSASQCGAKSVADANKSLSALLAKTDERISKKTIHPLYGAMHDTIWALGSFKTGGALTTEAAAVKKTLEEKTDASKATSETAAAKIYSEKLAEAKKYMEDGVDSFDGVDVSIKNSEEELKKIPEDIKAMDELFKKVAQRLDDAGKKIEEAKGKLAEEKGKTSEELIAERQKWIDDIAAKKGQFQGFRLELKDFIDRARDKRLAVESKELPDVKEKVAAAKKLLGLEKGDEKSVGGIAKWAKENVTAAKMPTSLDKSEHGCKREEGAGQFECKQGETTFQDDKKDEPYGREGGKLIGQLEEKAKALEGEVQAYLDKATEYRTNLHKAPGGPDKGTGERAWEKSDLRFYQKGDKGADIYKYVNLDKTEKVGPGGKSSTPDATVTATASDGDGVSALKSHDHGGDTDAD